MEQSKCHVFIRVVEEGDVGAGVQLEANRTPAVRETSHNDQWLRQRVIRCSKPDPHPRWSPDSSQVLLQRSNQYFVAQLYGGSTFAEKGVVFVSANYRLGRFGFFAFPELTKENADGMVGNHGFIGLMLRLNT
jgi:hypothetical protein